MWAHRSRSEHLSIRPKLPRGVSLTFRTVGESTSADLLRGIRVGAVVLLLALFSSSMIAPLLFASDDDSRQPACCRRNGAHKCSVTTGASSLSGPALFAAPCRSYAGPQTLPRPSATGRAVTSDTIDLVSNKSPLLSARDRRYRVAFDDSHQKRGPPIRLF